VTAELEDVFDGNEHIVAVVIQRPYMRQVYVPSLESAGGRVRTNR
jgi:hypothetical protein